eukprot:CAMPEP_0172205550 /NCGR_PEP_ID=MMETSP1050-20130122/32680_1 /TAXON_ID=233186 /ORGANISM="Cryptomonas curvata, Strain CCAP979/52" /LENGTH=213 /DNA_ID=CAMNT_0012884445 /DNA_START=282 /DNA_END=924 /DNA_ORIENTATION=-
MSGQLNGRPAGRSGRTSTSRRMAAAAGRRGSGGWRGSSAAVAVERVRALLAAAAVGRVGNGDRVQDPTAVRTGAGIRRRDVRGRHCRRALASLLAAARPAGMRGARPCGAGGGYPGAALPDVPDRLLADGEDAGDGGGAGGWGAGGGAGEHAEVDLGGLDSGEDGVGLGARRWDLGGGVEGGGAGAGEDAWKQAAPRLVVLGGGDELAGALVA